MPSPPSSSSPVLWRCSPTRSWASIDDVGDDVITAATELLSVLLLVFVFVELLGAVRVTIRERRLIAEPFLLVGIIASIKEIVVVAGAERPEQEGWAEFGEAMIEVGALALVILVLAISTLLLRRRQREPAEEAGCRSPTLDGPPQPSTPRAIRAAAPHPAARSTIVTVPLAPSTSTRSPVRIRDVATEQPTTHGMPYSRLTMAAWVSDPPPSQTHPAMSAKAGVQFGDVASHTRISALLQRW